MNNTCVLLILTLCAPYRAIVDTPGVHAPRKQTGPPMNREVLETWLREHDMEATRGESGEIIEVKRRTGPNPFDVAPAPKFNRNVVRGLAALPKLQRLDLSGTSLKDEYFADVQGFSELKELRLNSTAVSGMALRAFANSKRLELLTLDRTGEIAKGLNAIPPDSLRVLYVAGRTIGDETLETIGRFPNLRRASITSPLATADGVLSLGHLGNLEYLGIAAPVDAAVFDRLMRALPNCMCVFQPMVPDETR